MPARFMRHIFIALVCSALTASTAAAETFPMTWQLLDDAPVVSVKQGKCLAPDVQEMDDGMLRMYFYISGRGIGSAVSRNGLDWKLEPGLILEGLRHSDDYKQGQIGFDLGHPWLVRLDDEQWRMYMQANSGINTPLHILSAVSDDALEFTMESGERIQLSKKTGIRFAGHGRTWQQDDGTWAMVFSGNTFEDNGPSDIMLALSRDGIHWDIVDKMVYEDGHDPAIIRLTDGRVAMVFTYLKENLQVGFSEDGLHWTDAEPLELLDPHGRSLGEPDGDVALYRLPGGELRMLSNHPDGIAMLQPVE